MPALVLRIQIEPHGDRLPAGAIGAIHPAKHVPTARRSRSSYGWIRCGDLEERDVARLREQDDKGWPVWRIDPALLRGALSGTVYVSREERRVKLARACAYDTDEGVVDVTRAELLTALQRIGDRRAVDPTRVLGD